VFDDDVLELVADYLERVKDSGIEFDGSSILPQTGMAACVQPHLLGHHLIVFQDIQCCGL